MKDDCLGGMDELAEAQSAIIARIVEGVRDGRGSTTLLLLQAATTPDDPLLPALAAAVEAETPRVREAVLNMIEIASGRRSFPEVDLRALEEACRRHDPGSLLTVGLLGPRAKSLAPAVADMLCNSNERVRALAASTLAVLGDRSKPITSRLIALLDDPSESVQLSTAASLCRLGGSVAGRACLMRLAQHGNRESRERAAKLLDELGDGRE